MCSFIKIIIQGPEILAQSTGSDLLFHQQDQINVEVREGEDATSAHMVVCSDSRACSWLVKADID